MMHKAEDLPVAGDAAATLLEPLKGAPLLPVADKVVIAAAPVAGVR